MSHVRAALGSIWTIVGGLVLVSLGVVLWSLGAPADYGWFTYFPDDGSQFSIPPSRFGHEQLAGMALVAVGLVVTAAAAGFQLGARAGGSSSAALEDGAAD